MNPTTGIEKKSTARPARMPRLEESVGSEAFRSIDRMREDLAAQLTGGLSPTSLALAFHDWWIHLASAPGKQLELVDKASRKTLRPCLDPDE
jgi:polyhydroxyalkanoate synthase